MAKKNGNGTEEPLEKQLWKSADKLRKKHWRSRIHTCCARFDFPEIYLGCVWGTFWKTKKREKVNMPELTRKTKTNIKPRMCSLCLKKLVGHICFRKPSNPLSEKRGTKQWTSLKRKTIRWKVSCQRFTVVKILTQPV